MTLTTSRANAVLPTLSPPAVYVSPFRRLLARGQGLVLALLLIWALSGFWALYAADVATRVIGHDTAPSIAAAERIRSLLSDANRNLANMTLTHEPDDGPFSSAFRGDIADAEKLMVDAAQNITYGDAEKTPIVAILRGVAEYDRRVGAARSLGSGPLSLRADALIRSTILPATEALDKANYDELSANYGKFLDSKLWLVALAGMTSLAALAVLVGLQFQIYKHAKRILNVGLGAATIIVVAASAYIVVAFASASADLKTAKSDAFDSIYALTTLLAVANGAAASEGFWLVNYDDPSARKTYDDLFQTSMREVVGVDVSAALSDAANDVHFPGLLGDEFANITFVGEDNAALAALKAWADYVTIEKRMRALETDGHSVEAAAIAGGGKPGELNWAFNVFQRTIELTIKLNQDAFDAAIARSEAKINSGAYGALFAAWLVASGLAWFGIRQRLREYEF